MVAYIVTQKDYKFQVRLGYIARPCFKKAKKQVAAKTKPSDIIQSSPWKNN
jgi:hypothetical protein